MDYNKTLDETPLPDKLVKDLNLDDVLELLVIMRDLLKEKMSHFGTQSKVAEIIGASQSDVSDFVHGEKKRKWSYNRILTALEKLEAYNE